MNIDINKIVHIAQQAGDAIMAIYDSDFSVYEKNDKSPLTEADLAAHRLICDELARITPDIPVLSEESAAIPFATRSQWQRYWLVDPLDGTREFVKKNGEFTVNIALIENHDATLGVVYAPAKQLTFYGSRAQGAFRQNAHGNAEAIQVHKQRRQRLQVAGSRSHAGDSLQQFLNNVGEHDIVSMGSSLKLCLVADGSADIYPRLGPTSEWDTAASQAVVEAAGGRVTTLDLQPLKYNTKDSLLNPHFLVFGDNSVDWSGYLQ
ncbi:MAG: 3'(2'),5'-bisphosphate nucleotidase CysQ [Chromatiales bacterium]|jgi:3'(2'), 5'-bisphosphate nucleotidase